MKLLFNFLCLILGVYLGESLYQLSWNPAHWSVLGWFCSALGLIVGSAILAWGRE